MAWTPLASVRSRSGSTHDRSPRRDDKLRYPYRSDLVMDGIVVLIEYLQSATTASDT
jgi:hypothetical protein